MSALQPTLERACQLLRSRFPDIVSVDSPQILKESGRNMVVRSALQGEGSAQSVIIKKFLSQEECGLNDWSSLELMESIPGSERLAPRFLGGDRALGFFIMSDLGSEGNIDALLRGNDLAALTEAMLALARQTARLHAAATGEPLFEQRFDAIRSGLMNEDAAGREAEANRWMKSCERFRLWMKETGCEIPRGFDEACEEVNALYRDPGPALCFTHGDMAPTNNQLRGEEIFLIDFEYSGFRHPFYDMTVWETLCPLPDEVTGKIVRCYREEYLSHPGIPVSETGFLQAWEKISLWRAIAMLSWIPAKGLENDARWVEEWGMRDAFLHTLGVMEHGSVIRGSMACHDRAPIAEAAARLRRALQTRWPDASGAIPPWPVFSSTHDQ